jgi:3-hydroxyacyl-CoA dehydrogenase
METMSAISIEREGDILVAVIQNPPVNAGSLAVRQGLLQAIEELERDSSLRGAVVIGDGKTFIAGSDLREFGVPLQDPQLPAVIAAIENCSKPIVAALHGAALGGGFELALGCDARVAAPETVVGLPEVTLGMIPGAGGTQRLPRIVGVSRAIAMVCSGERLPAADALELGIVDAIAEGGLRKAAIAYAQMLKGRKSRLRDVAVPEENAATVDASEAGALELYGRRPNVVAAIEAVKWSTSLPIDQALEQERSAFTRLRMSDEAFALRHLFFAERQAAKRGPVSAFAAAQICLKLTKAALEACEELRIEGASAGQLEAAVASLGLAGGGLIAVGEPDEQVCRRIVRSMAEEALILVAEGVIETAADVDVIMVKHFNFPRWQGGPVFSASRERERS